MLRMDDPYRLEAKGLARAKIRGKRRRVQKIRRRTIRGSLALFATVWAIVFGQLVTGNDPALSRSSQGARQRLTSTDRGRSGALPVAPVETEPVPEPEAAPEPEVAPEPEPVVTSAS